MADETETETGSIAVGETIRSARERAGLTQAELGEALNVTQTCVSYWEAAKRDVGITDLIRIAEVLCVKAASLLPAPRQAAAVPAVPPLPDGEYARVEILGHDSHTGWVTDSTRAGAPVMVVRDWDGRVVAEIPGTSLYRFVPLATPLSRPVTRTALPPGRGGFDLEHEFADDEYEYGHDEDIDDGDDDE